MLCPASPEEAGLFYAQTPERDEELGTIGHVRIDFGYKGKEFWHTWWPRDPEELNTQEFRDELDKVVNDLRRGVLKDLSSMRRYCYGSAGKIEGGSCCQNYGFTLETGRYIYRLRCNPTEGDYQAYLSCFDKQAQRMGLTEQGHQRLRDAADPALPHDYLNKRIQETDFFQLNALAKRLAELDTRGMAVFEGLVCMDIQKGGETIPIGSLIDYAYSGDCCHVMEDIVTDEELGMFLVENGFIPEAEDLSDRTPVWPPPMTCGIS